MVKEEMNVERNLRKTKQGKVVSNKMDKTIVVAIDDKVKDPLYNKIKNNTIRIKSHEKKNEYSIEDIVQGM